MKVTLIAAVAENGTIGRDNDLPWNIRDDMRFFVRTTKGHAVIMGRLNYEAMGRPLPHRRNIVVSRNPDYVAEGCETTTSIEAALQMAEGGGEDEAFVIGGAQIYALAAPYAHCFYRTRVLAQIDGDVKFPALSLEGWDGQELLQGEKSEENEHAFIVERFERQTPERDYRSSRA